MVRLLLFVRLLLNHYDRVDKKNNTFPDPENDSHDATCTHRANNLTDAEARATQDYLKNYVAMKCAKLKMQLENVFRNTRQYTVQDNIMFVRAVWRSSEAD